MSAVDRFFGLAIRGEYLAYALLRRDSLFTLGSIDIRARSADYFSKINSVFGLVKSEVQKEAASEEPATADTWRVGIYHDPAPSRHRTDHRRAHVLVRMKTILECSCSLTLRLAPAHLSTAPIAISGPELCRAVGTRPNRSAKLSQTRIATVDDVVSFASGRLSAYLKGQPAPQLAALATSWATALALKVGRAHAQRRVSADALVLGEADTLKIRERLLKDRIVNELMDSISARSDDRDRRPHSPAELKTVLKRRVHKLVEDYVEALV